MLSPVQFKVRFDGELHEQLKASAARNNRSVNAEIVQRLRDSFSMSENELSFRVTGNQDAYRFWKLKEIQKLLDELLADPTISEWDFSSTNTDND
ncbi:TPA: Arc family DNA-binding protein [Serratia marcescens]|uniref:Arc family DNA-binding protein n=1 Tax=Serratia bockelmannii TaxID=2703793 RepID=UPI002FE55DD4